MLKSANSTICDVNKNQTINDQPVKIVDTRKNDQDASKTTAKVERDIKEATNQAHTKSKRKRGILSTLLSRKKFYKILINKLERYAEWY